MRVMFMNNTLPEEIVWAKMVLIPKERSNYRGVRLVEVLWKV